jgi:Zn-dependent M28 family amino/carboxypeptidase
VNSPTSHIIRIEVLIALVLAALAVVAVALYLQAKGPSKASYNGSSAGEARSASSSGTSATLRSAVKVSGLMRHERRFQAIADEHGGNRASGTPGYDASAAYVARELRRTGYEVAAQSFEVPFFQELEPARLQQVAPQNKNHETATLWFSGSGDVTGRLVPIKEVLLPPPAKPGSTSGCERDDFVPASETEPQLALIQRGTCELSVKAANAEAAGYDAVIIFNEGQEGRTGGVTGTLRSPDFSILVVGTSFATGEELYAATQKGKVVVRVFTSTLSETRVSSNVIAETPQGRTDHTVVVGAHLDSVIFGPGINDNGSGSATVLEIALQMSRLGIEPRNRIRFAFWGTEELGLLGSKHYVAHLPKDEVRDIAAYLNFDMVGSPNFVRNVYTGPDVTEKVFTDYFATRGIRVEVNSALDGRSDHVPFEARGIPSGGLFSGAEGIKTRGEAAAFGGKTGAAHDPCYHRACDDLANLDEKVLNQFSDAAAHATITLANDAPR